MRDDRGLTDLALPDLEALLGLIERGRVRWPLTEASLASHGLGHVFEHLAPLAALEEASLRPLLRVVIAERRFRPVPRTADSESRVSLHAKCIVVDETKALVTSANFTDRGQTRSIETGVHIDDPILASRLVYQWRSLIDAKLVEKG